MHLEMLDVIEDGIGISYYLTGMVQLLLVA